MTNMLRVSHKYFGHENGIDCEMLFYTTIYLLSLRGAIYPTIMWRLVFVFFDVMLTWQACHVCGLSYLTLSLLISG
jgi:hypothetical protein